MAAFRFFPLLLIPYSLPRLLEWYYFPLLHDFQLIITMRALELDYTLCLILFPLLQKKIAETASTFATRGVAAIR